MSLRDYRRKRDFTATPEPRGTSAPQSSRLRFVVQKHAASHLHYDFRLELDGVLKSWAVPKGPSLDPQQRRLAVEVEDHPLAYAEFEGTIPQGQYGGGTVVVWDRGRWIPDGDAGLGLRNGRLSFELVGEKLRGHWALVRLTGKADDAKKPQWLLIKKDDDAAVPDAKDTAEGRAPAPPPNTPRHPGKAKVSRAPMPAEVAMELPTPVDRAPDGDEWLHEIKLDGYRLWCRRQNGRVTLWTRGGEDWTHRFPTVTRALAALPPGDLLLDGELVALCADGRSSFQGLQRALREAREAELLYFAFDLLFHDGSDLRLRSLVERRGALAALLREEPTTPAVQLSRHLEAHGGAVLREACRLGLEGIVSKRRESPYRAGRTRDWLKVKCLREQELVIGGYTLPQGTRAGLGALLVGFHEDGVLRYAGRVGTGFDAATRADLARRLRPLVRKDSPFADPPRGARMDAVRWVRPRLVAQIRFSEWTADGRLRHPSFQGLREDKPAREVTRETPRETVALASRSRPTVPSRRARIAPATSVLSHPERVLFADVGITKAELAGYFEVAAERMLPHVLGRPLMLLRCPQGTTKQCFIQKHFEQAPPGVELIDVREDDGNKAVYGVVQGTVGLQSLAQLGALEVHVWGASLPDLDHPDRLILDLDPDPELPWPVLRSAAEKVRALLRRTGLQSWPKSTGGKGLHLVVPLSPGTSWADLKTFARAVAERLVRDDATLFVSKSAKAARTGRIYVDYLRNGRGATSIAAYSPRARADAPVAVPLRWSEVRGDERPRHTLRSLAATWRRRRSDPWRDFWTTPQTLTEQSLQEASQR